MLQELEHVYSFVSLPDSGYCFVRRFVDADCEYGLGTGAGAGACLLVFRFVLCMAVLLDEQGPRFGCPRGNGSRVVPRLAQWKLLI